MKRELRGVFCGILRCTVSESGWFSPRTCWKHVAETKSLINDLRYRGREIPPELMFKSRSLHQIGSLIMSEFAFRASKEEVARMNKLNRLIFSRSAAAVMSNTAPNETLMSRGKWSALKGVLTSKDDCLGWAAVALPVNEAGGGKEVTPRTG